MANRSRTSAHRKPQIHQLSIQQQRRARHLVALVPKPGAKSDLDDSESSAEDELQYCPRPTHSDSSSPPPSLPSSIENLNLLSDDDNEINQVVASTSLVLHSQSSLSTNPCSPSILSSNPSAIRQLQCAEASPLSPVPPLLDQVCLPSPLATSTQKHSPLATSSQVPSPLATSSQLPLPRASNLTCHNQVPSPLFAPSPSATTRSKRPRVVTIKRKVIPAKRLQPNWRCCKFTGSAEVKDISFEPREEKCAIEYFKLFFSDDIISLIVQQTNIYSTQTNGSSINITEDDIKDFLAILLFTGVVKMHAYTDYWSKILRYDKVADIMTLKKFQLLRRYIHFNDNFIDDDDRYHKVRPLLQKIRENCLKVEEESRFSIDEMMVPHKGTRAGSRKQYVKNKPKKWGFKIFVRAGVSGIVYDFLIYGGDDTFRFNSFTDEENGMGLGSKVVLALAKSIHQPACKVLCFDNFFTSIELLQYLRNEYGIFALGTIRSNRLRGAEKKLPTDKNLKKSGRGSHAQVVCNKNKIVVVKWYDNKCVTAASTFVDAHPIQNVVRYKKAQGRKMPVTCPNLIKEYNTDMGGVDLADMLIALYRTPFRGHRWYLPIFSQMLDICVNNAWLLYRRHREDRHEAKKPKSLKTFRIEIFESLRRFERTNTSNISRTSVSSTKTIQRPVAERPPDAVRYDQVAHYPNVTPIRGRCMYCKKGQTKLFCEKCKMRLCLLPERNCFVEYHTKK
ncbi:unnamed protein product, partial [Brenthis ino]